MRDGKDSLIRKVEQYKPLIVCFNGKGNTKRVNAPSKHRNKRKRQKKLFFNINRIFLVRIGGTSRKFCLVMVRILARCTGGVKIPLARPNESDMSLRCAIKRYD